MGRATPAASGTLRSTCLTLPCDRRETVGDESWRLQRQTCPEALAPASGASNTFTSGDEVCSMVNVPFMRVSPRVVRKAYSTPIYRAAAERLPSWPV